MTEFVIEVKDSETKFIKDLLKRFDFVNIKGKKKPKLTAESHRILDNLEDAVNEFNLYKEGKIELQDAFEMLEEIKEELKKEGVYEN